MDNLPYAFDDERGEISISRFDLPDPWINYLSNGEMHAFVSQAGGGMCWWRSPMVFRITRYRFYNLPIDSPGFYVYIRCADGTVWSPTFRPVKTPVDSRSCRHLPGMSVFEARKDGLVATLRLAMAQDVNALIWDLDIQNGSGERQDLDVFAYAELSQFLAKEENLLGYYLKWNVRSFFETSIDAVVYAYTAWMHPRKDDAPLVYFGSDQKVSSFCCSRDAFCGQYRDESDPVEVSDGKLSNTELEGGEPCAALHRKTSVEDGSSTRMAFFLGVAPGALANYEAALGKAREDLALLRHQGAVDRQLEKLRSWWDGHLACYRCNIPDEAAQRNINLWNPVQCVHTARYSRSISSCASGVRGVGFRDSAQDMLAQAYRKPMWSLDVLSYLASQQFEDGHPMHIMWPEEKRPAQDITRSDNHLWLVFLAHAIVAETGDVSLLDREVPFLAKDGVTPTAPASLWEHLVRGIDFTETHLGAHGLPLILFSDWNDHLGPFGRKGRGETTMVSQQLIVALDELEGMARMRGDEKAAERFSALAKEQRRALEAVSWDGHWFLRGFDDEGKAIGSHVDDHMSIWLNAQSWMVIAGAGTRDRQVEAMDSAERELGTGIGLLLNAPGYPGWPDPSSAMVNGLPAGYSENGGIFLQANCWAILAEALLGRGNKAWDLYEQTMPQNIARRIGVDRYRSEPYAYCSTLLGKENPQFGRGCVSQVTGTAAWMDVVATQYLLGVRPTLKGLVIDPSIPSSWDGFAVERLYRGCRVFITVENPCHVEHGVRRLEVNGAPIEVADEACIDATLFDGLAAASVVVTLGR